jgi:hypothetical protein
MSSFAQEIWNPRWNNNFEIRAVRDVMPWIGQPYKNSYELRLILIAELEKAAKVPLVWNGPAISNFNGAGIPRTHKVFYNALRALTMSEIAVYTYVYPGHRSQCYA